MRTATMQLSQAAAALVGLPTEEQRSAAVAHFAQELVAEWDAGDLPLIELVHAAGDLLSHIAHGGIAVATVTEAEQMILAGWHGGELPR